MRFIPTSVHGVLDYLFGVVLIATPWLLGFADWSPGHLVLFVIGLGAIGYALITDYELGVWKILKMPAHLSMDVVGGLVLLASPFFPGFQDHVYWPHLALGAFAVVAGAFTVTAPGYYPAHVLRV
jgi:hypothetical protein